MLDYAEKINSALCCTGISLEKYMGYKTLICSLLHINWGVVVLLFVRNIRQSKTWLHCTSWMPFISAVILISKLNLHFWKKIYFSNKAANKYKNLNFTNLSHHQFDSGFEAKSNFSLLFLMVNVLVMALEALLNAWLHEAVCRQLRGTYDNFSDILLGRVNTGIPFSYFKHLYWWQTWLPLCLIRQTSHQEYDTIFYAHTTRNDMQNVLWKC